MKAGLRVAAYRELLPMAGSEREEHAVREAIMSIWLKTGDIDESEVVSSRSLSTREFIKLMTGRVV